MHLLNWRNRRAIRRNRCPGILGQRTIITDSIADNSRHISGKFHFPLVLAAAAAVDYGFANDAKARLVAVADSAALAAVTREAMSLSTTDARTQAQNVLAEDEP